MIALFQIAQFQLYLVTWAKIKYRHRYYDLSRHRNIVTDMSSLVHSSRSLYLGVSCILYSAGCSLASEHVLGSVISNHNSMLHHCYMSIMYYSYVQSTVEKYYIWSDYISCKNYNCIRGILIMFYTVTTFVTNTRH